MLLEIYLKLRSEILDEENKLLNRVINEEEANILYTIELSSDRKLSTTITPLQLNTS